MRFIPVTCEQRAKMLRAVGVNDIEDLLADVPADARLGRPLDLPAAMSEVDLTRHLRGLAASNTPASSLVSFAGAGCYEHHIPSVVDHVVRKPEFLTAYTPYQPEVSQGTLQATHEYQTMVCELTGMEVANASMYDGATALVEAALMACRITGRGSVAVAGTLHPEWRAVLDTYSSSGSFAVTEARAIGGVVPLSAWGDAVGADTAAVLVASPNFLGNLEAAHEVVAAAHSVGALCVVASNPILLGVMEPPGTYGADMVVAEGQPLGSAMSFGGPGLGLFTCREEHVRQMPGRVVGRTVDADGDEGYVLTLATREQHIRRERATSNICSNHALNALAVGAYLAAVGPEGLAGVARACMAKARHLRAGLLATGAFTAPWDHPYGYEFALHHEGDTTEMHARMLRRGYLAGVPLDDGLVLFAVTEVRTREEIDAFVREVGVP